MPLGLRANSVSFFSCPALTGAGAARDASRGKDAGCPSNGRCGSIALPTPGPKGKLFVCVNGTNPLRSREALFISASCYSNELLLSPRETPMCPEASPPTRPSLLAWRLSPSPGRPHQPLPRALRQRGGKLLKVLRNVD